MPTETTPHFSLPMPHADNLLEDDVNRLRAALTELDTQLFVAAEARQALDAMLAALQGSLASQGIDFSAQLGELGTLFTQHAALAATPDAKGHTMPGTGLGVDASGKVSVTYGTAAGTACAGDDARLTTPASATQAGHVKLNNTVSSTSTTEAATAAAVKQAFDKANSINIPLNNSVSSTSTTEAATANAVKQAYDRANSAASTASSAYSMANSAYSTANSAYSLASNAGGAPVPNVSGGKGHWLVMSITTGYTFYFPAGGTWVYFYHNLGIIGGERDVPTNSVAVGIVPGGTQIHRNTNYAVGLCGFTWRIS